MNDKINELHNTIDAKDKIINEQVLEIARLNEARLKAIEVVRLCNTKCSKEVIEILKGDDNE